MELSAADVATITRGTLTGAADARATTFAIDSRVVVPPRAAGLSAEGGRGLFMIWSLMSSVQVAHHTGTHLVMIKELFPKGS